MSEPTDRLQSLWTVVDGLKLYGRVSAGPADAGRPSVVLVHGLGVSGDYLLPTAVRLAECCRVYVPDLPGFGRSERPRWVPDVAELADALVGWMDAVGVGRAALVGNSLGCQVAVNCAVRYPRRVGCLGLLSPTMDPGGPTAAQQTWRLLRATPLEPPSLWYVVVRDYLRCGPARLLRTLRYGLAHRVADELPRVGVPALVLRGARDPIVSQGWAEEVARLLPHGRLAVIPDGGHALNYSRAEETTRLLLPLLLAEAGAPAVRRLSRAS